MILLNGREVATTIKKEIIQRVLSLKERGIYPKINVIVATDDPSAASYINSKVKIASALGIVLEIKEVSPSKGQVHLEDQIKIIAMDTGVHGIILELPLDKGLDANSALDCIPANKDVDGISSLNVGRVTIGNETTAILATTPMACIRLAETFSSLSGKRVAVVGRGRTVGRALAGLLVNRDATPIICHSKTEKLGEVLKSCDVVIVAVGKAGLISSEHLRQGHIILDAGINVLNGRIIGDVNAEAAKDAGVEALSPVPGGVGPITSVLIFENLLKCISLQLNTQI